MWGGWLYTCAPRSPLPPPPPHTYTDPLMHTHARTHAHFQARAYRLLTVAWREAGRVHTAHSSSRALPHISFLLSHTYPGSVSGLAHKIYPKCNALAGSHAGILHSPPVIATSSTWPFTCYPAFHLRKHQPNTPARKMLYQANTCTIKYLEARVHCSRDEAVVCIYSRKRRRSRTRTRRRVVV